MLIGWQALTFQSFSFAFFGGLLCFTDTLHKPCVASLVILGFSWYEIASAETSNVSIVHHLIHSHSSKTYSILRTSQYLLVFSRMVFPLISVFSNTGLGTYKFVSLVLLLSASGHYCLLLQFEYIKCLTFNALNRLCYFILHLLKTTKLVASMR